MKTLLVFGRKNFKITVPDDAKVTFGPWSPPSEAQKYATSDRALEGTLRIYSGQGKATENILAVFAGVSGFRDISLEYAEEVTVLKGATVWNSDKDGYQKEEKVSRNSLWDDPFTAIAE